MAELKDIFTTQNIIIYLVVINILGFLVMWIDKKKAERNAWRIKERTLFIITALGGGIGTLTGMYVFRHKTQKISFVIGIPLILILEVITALYFIIINL